MKNWVKQLKSTTFEKGIYSQKYQDHLLEIIFENIGTTNPTPFCVEFGFNSKELTDGSGANVAKLVLEEQWDCLLLDGENENPTINLHKHFLRSGNILEVFEQYNVPSEPEYISIDVDSTDLWLFDTLAGRYKAMVYSVEYNSHFPLDSSITFPNDPNERWEGDRGFGASLNLVANRHGYSLLWVVPCLDAFFIRNDLIDDESGQICFPYENWSSCTNRIHHRPLKRKERTEIFIDYEVYLQTNGDTEKSQKAAQGVCRKFLLDSISQVAFKHAKRIARSLIGPKRAQ